MAKQTPGSTVPAAWAAARELADWIPQTHRRSAGPSLAISRLGALMFSMGIAGAVIVGSIHAQTLDFWVLITIYLGLGLAVGGFLLFVWAAPDKYLAVTAMVMRAGETAGRRVRLWLSATNFGVVIGFLAWAVTSRQPGWVYLLLLAFALAGTLLATSALSAGAAVVSATSAIRGYSGRRWALMVSSLGVCTIGAVVGAGSARYLNAQAVWPSVTLAVLGIVATVFAQHHKELNEAVDGLSHALANLHSELIASDKDPRKLRAAATDVESAITIRARGPFAIAPLPLVDGELRICLYYLLAVVTELPIRVTSTDQADMLAKRLGDREPTILLAELAWEIRRRLYRSAKSIRRLDEQAFTSVVYPTIPAQPEIAAVDR